MVSLGDFKRGVATLDGIELACLEAAAGPPLLCLHGFPDTPITFANPRRAFPSAGHWVVAP